MQDKCPSTHLPRTLILTFTTYSNHNSRTITAREGADIHDGSFQGQVSGRGANVRTPGRSRQDVDHVYWLGVQRIEMSCVRCVRIFQLQQHSACAHLSKVYIARLDALGQERSTDLSLSFCAVFLKFYSIVAFKAHQKLSILDRARHNLVICHWRRVRNRTVFTAFSFNSKATQFQLLGRIARTEC